MNTPTSAADESSLRLFALISYGLLLLAGTNGLTAIVAVVLAYIKRDEARGTPFESHFSNIVTVFWSAIAAIAIVVAAAGASAITLFGGPEPHHVLPQAIGIGIVLWAAAVGFVVWYLYRVIRGFIRAIDGRAYA
ncbi:MAG TPA: hypothetical protein VMH86_15815 [Rhizomicrobium sp.]|nr:hypothetical protein [Rhizomicrobium sp.]